MKNASIIFVVFLVFSSTIFAQNSWSYKSGGNAFDGKYKVAFIQGIGDNYPYKKPYLLINRFENNERINIYINKAGYHTETTGARVFIKLDNEPDVLYKTYSHSFSNDGDSIFLESFMIDGGKGTNSAVVNQLEFISKLKTASKLSVRIKNQYGQNDLTFSLKGSSRAIDFVIPNLNNLISQIDSKNLESSILLERLLNDCKEHGLTIYSIEQLEARFKQDLGLGYNEALATEEPYDSIAVDGVFESGLLRDKGYVEVSYVLADGSKKTIDGAFKVNPDSPLMTEYLEGVKRKEKGKNKRKKALEVEKNRVYEMLEKFGREDIKQFILNSISEEVIKGKFSFQRIDSINAVFSKILNDEILFLNILISLEENNIYQLVTLPRTRDIHILETDLEKLGAKMDEPF